MLIFGPTEFAEGDDKAGERKANDIEIATLDTRNEAASITLDSIGAGLVERFTGSEVVGDLV